MGYYNTDELRELEEAMMRRKYNRHADRNILFIFFLFVAFLLYTAMVGIFNSKQN